MSITGQLNQLENNLRDTNRNAQITANQNLANSISNSVDSLASTVKGAYSIFDQEAKASMQVEYNTNINPKLQEIYNNVKESGDWENLEANFAKEANNWFDNTYANGLNVFQKTVLNREKNNWIGQYQNQITANKDKWVVEKAQTDINNNYKVISDKAIAGELTLNDVADTEKFIPEALREQYDNTNPKYYVNDESILGFKQFNAVNELINNGTSLENALKEVLGDNFNSVIRDIEQPTDSRASQNRYAKEYNSRLEKAYATLSQKYNEQAAKANYDLQLQACYNSAFAISGDSEKSKQIVEEQKTQIMEDATRGYIIQALQNPFSAQSGISYDARISEFSTEQINPLTNNKYTPEEVKLYNSIREQELTSYTVSQADKAYSIIDNFSIDANFSLADIDKILAEQGCSTQDLINGHSFDTSRRDWAVELACYKDYDSYDYAPVDNNLFLSQFIGMIGKELKTKQQIDDFVRYNKPYITEETMNLIASTDKKSLESFVKLCTTEGIGDAISTKMQKMDPVQAEMYMISAISFAQDGLTQGINEASLLNKLDANYYATWGSNLSEELGIVSVKDDENKYQIQLTNITSTNRKGKTKYTDEYINYFEQCRIDASSGKYDDVGIQQIAEDILSRNSLTLSDIQSKFAFIFASDNLKEDERKTLIMNYCLKTVCEEFGISIPASAEDDNFGQIFMSNFSGNIDLTPDSSDDVLFSQINLIAASVYDKVSVFDPKREDTCGVPKSITNNITTTDKNLSYTKSGEDYYSVNSYTNKSYKITDIIDKDAASKTAEELAGKINSADDLSYSQEVENAPRLYINKEEGIYSTLSKEIERLMNDYEKKDRYKDLYLSGYTGKVVRYELSYNQSADDYVITPVYVNINDYFSSYEKNELDRTKKIINKNK